MFKKILVNLGVAAIVPTLVDIKPFYELVLHEDMSSEDFWNYVQVYILPGFFFMFTIQILLILLPFQVIKDYYKYTDRAFSFKNKWILLTINCTIVFGGFLLMGGIPPFQLALYFLLVIGIYSLVMTAILHFTADRYSGRFL